ncbi:MAG: DUF4965 domain-containing protein [Acidobacteriaceae bacterium]|nr:DUF4965 domain-containing protein [Acidobacteriaceae bacterium]
MFNTICRVLALLTVAATAQAADFRPPAVPLVTHDPYFSIWSMADRLTDEPTKHWTGKVNSLSSLVRLDGRTYRIMGRDPRSAAPLPQTRLEVLPTHTRYQFEGAGVRVTLTFLTPALPDDFDILSRPATYITWQVQSIDAKPHQVSIYFDAGSDIAVNTTDEPVVWSRYKLANATALSVGTRQQPMLEKSGDDLRIDWGHLYVVAPPGEGVTGAATLRRIAMQSFASTGHVPDQDDLAAFRPYAQPTPALAFAFDLGDVSTSAIERHLVFAYDDEYSIEYLERRLRPYWRRNGQGAAEMLTAALQDYEPLSKRADEFDRQLMTDLRNAGGDQYAQLCALAYRQTLAAHKLVADVDGTPFYFSKENFSNGSIDTVDVTYPSSPFFLFFAPRLLEAQLKPMLEYASLPRWHFPFAPHDLGRYPLANGQQYGGGEKTEEDQMPVEESGNMLLMAAALEKFGGNNQLTKEYWPLLTRWAEYLKSEGLDPANQLCTDDFAGHMAHNANLSIKAILALAAYGKMAASVGENAAAKQYAQLAHDYAAKWVGMDRDENHFRLAFDNPGTWSQKYNLVWDKLLDLHVFPANVAREELAFYGSHENKYGLPLDNRAAYTKLDWLAWTASLAPNQADFEQLFANPAYLFAQESPSRVPLTDWYDTVTGKQVGFQARSVVGGIFIRLLDQPQAARKYRK